MAVVLAVFVCRRLGPFSGGLWRMAVVLAVFVCRRLGLVAACGGWLLF